MVDVAQVFGLRSDKEVGGLKIQSFGIIDLDGDGDLDVGLRMKNGATLVFHNEFKKPQGI